jgi:hypothetical protein
MMLAEVYEACGVIPYLEIPSIQRIGTFTATRNSTSTA